MSTPLPFKIKLGPSGTGSTEISGLDVSNHVRSIEVTSSVHEATIVKIEFINVEVNAEGEAEVNPDE